VEGRIESYGFDFYTSTNPFDRIDAVPNEQDDAGDDGDDDCWYREGKGCGRVSPYVLRRKMGILIDVPRTTTR
jgi:hypothetical protein